jgi:hypothetical protein
MKPAGAASFAFGAGIGLTGEAPAFDLVAVSARLS